MKFHLYNSTVSFVMSIITSLIAEKLVKTGGNNGICTGVFHGLPLWRRPASRGTRACHKPPNMLLRKLSPNLPTCPSLDPWIDTYHTVFFLTGI